jgi:hypothetical protein
MRVVLVLPAHHLRAKTQCDRNRRSRSRAAHYARIVFASRPAHFFTLPI